MKRKKTAKSTKAIENQIRLFTHQPTKWTFEENDTSVVTIDTSLSLADRQLVQENNRISINFDQSTYLAGIIQSLPCLAAAAAASDYMLVEINGSLAKSTSTEGAFRAFSHDSNGKIDQVANLKPGNLQSILNTSILLNIGSIVFAQWHLKNINTQLSKLRTEINLITQSLQNAKISSITGTISYLKQITPSILRGENIDIFRSKIEDIELLLTQLQLSLQLEMTQLANRMSHFKANELAGSNEQFIGVQDIQDKFYFAFSLWLLCTKTRLMTFNILSFYPNEELLKENRLTEIQLSINQVLNKNGAVNNMSHAIQNQINNLNALFNSVETLHARREMIADMFNGKIVNVFNESKAIHADIEKILSCLTKKTNVKTRLALKIKNNEVHEVFNLQQA